MYVHTHRSFCFSLVLEACKLAPAPSAPEALVCAGAEGSRGSLSP